MCFLPFGRLFLSTLSLRRATLVLVSMTCLPLDFYPRSPCGERQLYVYRTTKTVVFLSTLSLRRATPTATGNDKDNIFLSTLSLRRATRVLDGSKSSIEISIHALLAESDPPYNLMIHHAKKISIHALLAESDRICKGNKFSHSNFYPRSPCGERPCITTTTIFIA